MKILVVDDNNENLYMLESLLQGYGYEVETANDGVQALKKAKQGDFDMIISDILMPRMDGFQLCRKIKSDEKMKTIPFVFYTAAYTYDKDREFGLSLGADRYIVKPTEPDVFIEIIRELFAEKGNPVESSTYPPVKEETVHLKEHNERLAKKLEYEMLELEKANRALKASLKKLRKTTEGVIHAVALTIETRDPYTAGHQRRVARISRAIAEEMGLDNEKTEGIYTAAGIHDIGKISVPAEILTKPGRITDIEYSLVKTHSPMGYDILKTIEFPWPIGKIVLQHHERLDGSGYPAGLSGDNILLEARIVAVADVIEAMSSHRPYRPALGMARALEEISQNKGILYDPDVADACLRLFERGFSLE